MFAFSPPPLCTMPQLSECLSNNGVGLVAGDYPSMVQNILREYIARKAFKPGKQPDDNEKKVALVNQALQVLCYRHEQEALTGEFAASLKNLKLALGIKLILFGRDDVVFYKAKAEIANLYCSNPEWIERGLDLFEMTLPKLKEKLAGNVDSDFARYAHFYGSELFEHNKFEQSIEWLQIALNYIPLSPQSLIADNTACLLELNNKIAFAYVTLKKYQDAKIHIEQALEICRSKKAQHPMKPEILFLQIWAYEIQMDIFSELADEDGMDQCFQTVLQVAQLNNKKLESITEFLTDGTELKKRLVTQLESQNVFFANTLKLLGMWVARDTDRTSSPAPSGFSIPKFTFDGQEDGVD